MTPEEVIELATTRIYEDGALMDDFGETSPDSDAAPHELQETFGRFGSRDEQADSTDSCGGSIQVFKWTCGVMGKEFSGYHNLEALCTEAPATPPSESEHASKAAKSDASFLVLVRARVHSFHFSRGNHGLDQYLSESLGGTCMIIESFSHVGEKKVCELVDGSIVSVAGLPVVRPYLIYNMALSITPNQRGFQPSVFASNQPGEDGAFSAARLFGAARIEAFHCASAKTEEGSPPEFCARVCSEMYSFDWGLTEEASAKVGRFLGHERMPTTRLSSLVQRRSTYRTFIETSVEALATVFDRGAADGDIATVRPLLEANVGVLLFFFGAEYIRVMKLFSSALRVLEMRLDCVLRIHEDTLPGNPARMHVFFPRCASEAKGLARRATVRGVRNVRDATAMAAPYGRTPKPPKLDYGVQVQSFVNKVSSALDKVLLDLLALMVIDSLANESEDSNATRFDFEQLQTQCQGALERLKNDGIIDFSLATVERTSSVERALVSGGFIVSYIRRAALGSSAPAARPRVSDVVLTLQEDVMMLPYVRDQMNALVFLEEMEDALVEECRENRAMSLKRDFVDGVVTCASLGRIKHNFARLGGMKTMQRRDESSDPYTKPERLVPMCDEHQRALEVQSCEPIVILDGPGGAGKSTWLCRVFEKYPTKVQLCMGQTSTVSEDLTERVGAAFTCHRLVVHHCRSCGHRPGASKAQENPEPVLGISFSTCIFERLGVVYLDEHTLVDESLMASTLWALVRCAKNLRQIIMAGNFDQLPPVGRGYPSWWLMDYLITYEESRGVVKFKHNHRVDPEFAVIRRTCEAIKNGSVEDMQLSEATGAFSFADMSTSFDRVSDQASSSSRGKRSAADRRNWGIAKKTGEQAELCTALQDYMRAKMPDEETLRVLARTRELSKELARVVDCHYNGLGELSRVVGRGELVVGRKFVFCRNNYEYEFANRSIGVPVAIVAVRRDASVPWNQPRFGAPSSMTEDQQEEAFDKECEEFMAALESEASGAQEELGPVTFLAGQRMAYFSSPQKKNGVANKPSKLEGTIVCTFRRTGDAMEWMRSQSAPESRRDLLSGMFPDIVVAYRRPRKCRTPAGAPLLSVGERHRAVVFNLWIASNVRSAGAQTVSSAQSQQAMTVVFAAGSPWKYENRNLVFTAASRAQNELAFLVTRNFLHESLARTVAPAASNLRILMRSLPELS